MARCFIVLGAPFSGSSELTSRIPHNVYLCGLSVAALHSRLLNACGAVWHDPKEVIWNDEFKAIRDKIIDEVGQHDTWVLLDSLTPFTIRGWLDALDDYKIIGILRNPKPFAKVLEEEYGFVYKDCLSIWRRYNDKIVALEHEFGPFPSVNFSSETFDDDVRELFHNVGLK